MHPEWVIAYPYHIGFGSVENGYSFKIEFANHLIWLFGFQGEILIRQLISSVVQVSVKALYSIFFWSNQFLPSRYAVRFTIFCPK